MVEFAISIIAAFAIILFLTGMYYSCKRGYIIPSRIDLQVECQAIGYRNLDRGDWAERGF